MAHCPPELLNDLTEVLAEVRNWPGVVEKRPGVFYLRRQPFLHFHVLAGHRRCADAHSFASFDGATRTAEPLRQRRPQGRGAPREPSRTLPDDLDYTVFMNEMP